MGLIGVALLLFVAVVALLVTVFDALSRVLVAAVGAIARAPWRGGQLIGSRVHDNGPAAHGGHPHDPRHQRPDRNRTGTGPGLFMGTPP